MIENLDALYSIGYINNFIIANKSIPLLPLSSPLPQAQVMTQ
jgi:hypothetical protein